MENKHKSKHLGIIILICFILIVIAIITYVVINYNSNQAEVKKRMDSALKGYNIFKNNVENFNIVRESVYSEIMQDMYYQDLKDNDTRYKEIFNDYSEKLKIIDKDYKNLKDKCINVLYPDVNINNKCEAFVIGYEEVVNTYISDINIYNSKVSAYNKWLIENNSSDTRLEEIKINRNYIDINGDREYKGKKTKEDVIKSEEGIKDE